MKIALQYSGMIRTFKYCYPKVMKVLKEYDVHIFMSIWDIPGHSLKYKKNPVMAYPELEYKNITIDFIKNEFPELDFKTINIEKYEHSKKIMDDFNKENGGDLIDYKQEIISGYYQVKSANNLREEYQKKSGEKYDWFMRLRPDVSIESIPDLTQIKTPILFLNKYIWEDPNHITFTPNYNTGLLVNNDTGTTLWITNNELIMNHLCNLIYKIKNLWDNNTYGEKILGKYITRVNKKKKTLKQLVRLYDFKVKILRSHGYSQNHGEIRNWK